jgi:hypothetical protein
MKQDHHETRNHPAPSNNSSNNMSSNMSSKMSSNMSNNSSKNMSKAREWDQECWGCG